jgi:hypothetical protein
MFLNNKNLKCTLLEIFVWAALFMSFLLVFIYFPASEVYSKYVFVDDPRGEQMYAVVPLAIIVSHIFLFLHF